MSKHSDLWVAADWMWRVLDDEGRNTPAMRELRAALDAPKPVMVKRIIGRKLVEVPYTPKEKPGS